MANKAELIKEIEALAENLGVSIPELGDLNKTDLEAELLALQNLDTAAGEDDGDSESEPEIESAGDSTTSEPEGDSYVVGKAALTTLRGVITPGDAIELKDISGGDENFNRLMEAGLIVKK